jgi:signal transduction histidine kinase
MSVDATKDTFQAHPVEEVERALDLEAADREDLPGLYRFNVIRVPALRLIGCNVLLFVVAAHNLLRFGELDFASYLPLVIGLELYSLISWGLLKTYFTRVTRVHLGDVFLITDFLPWCWAISASGGPDSFLWPVFLMHTADQLWLNRARARVMAGLGPFAYLALVAYWTVVAGQEVVWGAEIAKLMVLITMNIFMVLIAEGPWHQQEKTHAAKDLILRLEGLSGELDAARRKAEEANEAKSEFLGRMSHELRTPLHSVLGFSNVLLKNKHLSLESRDLDYLRRIRVNSMHLLNLINDLLDVARIEEGGIKLELSDVDVPSLVSETVDQLEDWGLMEDVVVQVKAPDTPLSVRADESRLRQVLIKLIGNAIKFTDEGSITVVLDVVAGAPPAIRVVDTGVGIPSDRLATIFDAFEQGDGGTTRRHDGAGLGLAISRSLCELMGMDLVAQSTLGEGSTFTIAIPESLVVRESLSKVQDVPPNAGG